VRSATWEGEIPRYRLSISTRNTLGAISTLFEVNEEAASDLLNSFKKLKKEGGGQGKEEEEEDQQQQKDEIKKEQLDKSKEFIKDKISADLYRIENHRIGEHWDVVESTGLPDRKISEP
jgi:restriction system protein